MSMSNKFMCRVISEYIMYHTHSTNNYYLIMEDGGYSIFEFVKKAHKFIECGRLKIAEWHRIVKIIFKQMIQAIDYIHTKNVAHMDISLENWLINDVSINMTPNNHILFADNKGKGVEVKLCDFGLAQLFPVSKSKSKSNSGSSEFKWSTNWISNKFCGKRNYKSPEIALKQVFNAQSNDMWCLGICLFMMIIGSAPWSIAIQSDPSFIHIMNGNLLLVLDSWKKLSYVDKDLIQLFDSFFKYENERITMEQLKKCKWLN